MFLIICHKQTNYFQKFLKNLANSPDGLNCRVTIPKSTEKSNRTVLIDDDAVKEQDNEF